jgi:hypothetical protein
MRTLIVVGLSALSLAALESTASAQSVGVYVDTPAYAYGYYEPGYVRVYRYRRSDAHSLYWHHYTSQEQRRAQDDNVFRNRSSQ